jgi:hypothetical protein
MAESGRIAAKLRGTFRPIVAGTGLRKVSTTVMAMPATRVSSGPARRSRISSPPVAGHDATIDLVND